MFCIDLQDQVDALKQELYLLQAAMEDHNEPEQTDFFLTVFNQRMNQRVTELSKLVQQIRTSSH